MKSTLSLLILLVSVQVFAAPKAAIPAEEEPSDVHVSSACETKVEAFVKSTALAMGLSEKFGVQFSTENAGNDLHGEPLVSLNSGVFIIDEGYISNSGATLTVRPDGSSCSIVSANISIGG